LAEKKHTPPALRASIPAKFAIFGLRLGYSRPPEHTLLVETADANRKFVYLSVDGGKAFSLKNGDVVRTRQSKFVTKLVRLSKKSFCEILDSKMGMEALKHEK